MTIISNIVLQPAKVISQQPQQQQHEQQSNSERGGCQEITTSPTSSQASFVDIHINKQLVSVLMTEQHLASASQHNKIHTFKGGFITFSPDFLNFY